LLRNLLHNFRLAWKFPRWRWAILTAVLSDALGFTVVLFPPMEWLLDKRYRDCALRRARFPLATLGGPSDEAVPGLQLFPA
jgi:hypothetical protein